MVRHAFRVLTGDSVKTRLIAFSDDMDGLRKVPDNIPNRDLIARHLGKPLTQVPDPFGEYESFAAHNNARLRAFSTVSASTTNSCRRPRPIKSGRFDEALMRMLERFDEVQAIMLPSLREERAATYSPFLPIHPQTGVVMQAPVLGARCRGRHDPLARSRHGRGIRNAGDRRPVQAAVEAGLGDALACARRRLRNGGQGPDRFGQALVADRARARGASRRPGSITSSSSTRTARRSRSPRATASRSRNGWPTPARRACRSSCSRSRRAAKRLYFDVIPRTVDDYLGFLDAYPRQEWKERLGNPVWHIHAGAPPAPEILTHGQARAGDLLRHAAQSRRGRQQRKSGGAVGVPPPLAPAASPETHPRLDSLVRYAVAYFRDFVAPKKRYREADEVERDVLAADFGQARGIAGGRERGRDPARALRYRAADSALSGSCPPRARPRRGRASRTTSSTWSTRCCSAKSGGRASAPSSRSTGSRKPAQLIDKALAGELVRGQAAS